MTSTYIYAVGRINSDRDIVIVPVEQDADDAYALGEMDATDGKPSDPLYYFSDAGAITDYLAGYAGQQIDYAAEASDLREARDDESFWAHGAW